MQLLSLWTYALLSPPVHILLAYRAFLGVRRRRLTARRIQLRSESSKPAFAGVSVDVSRHVSIDEGDDGSLKDEPLDHLVRASGALQH